VIVLNRPALPESPLIRLGPEQLHAVAVFVVGILIEVRTSSRVGAIVEKIPRATNAIVREQRHS